MTKKDFIAIADTLRAFFKTNAGREMDGTSKGVLINHFRNLCKQSNPQFDADKWLAYVTKDWK